MKQLQQSLAQSCTLRDRAVREVLLQSFTYYALTDGQKHHIRDTQESDSIICAAKEQHRYTHILNQLPMIFLLQVSNIKETSYPPLLRQFLLLVLLQVFNPEETFYTSTTSKQYSLLALVDMLK